MEKMYLSCSACEKEFCVDIFGNFILECYHFRCKDCSSNSNGCKIDGSDQLLEENTKKIEEALSGYSQENCLDHNLALECFCKTCQKLICYRCILNHRSHEIYDESELEEINQEFQKNFYKSQIKNIKESESLSLQVRNIKAKIKSLRAQISIINNEKQHNILEVKKKYSDDLRYFFQSKNEFFANKILRFREDCLVLEELTKKGLEYIENKQRILIEAKDDLRMILNSRAFEIEEIGFIGTSLKSTDLIYPPLKKLRTKRSRFLNKNY